MQKKTNKCLLMNKLVEDEERIKNFQWYTYFITLKKEIQELCYSRSHKMMIN